MRPARLMWPAFAAAVAVVLAAMAWATATVLRLDAAEAESRSRAQLEENVRLALWRMDSALAPLIAAEHARPAAGAINPPPAPLPGTSSHFVRLRFRFDPSGRLELPDGTGIGSDLAHLRGNAAQARLLSALPPAAAPAPADVGALAQLPSKGGKGSRGSQEYQARAANTSQQVVVQSNAYRVATDPADEAATGPLTPLWLGDDLLLARRVASAPRDSVQGCQVDWPAVRGWLLQSVHDLLPHARLAAAPHAPDTGDAGARLLASLPVRLEPGPLPASADFPSRTPLRVSLAVAWGCVVLAIVAVGLLLHGVAALSERRGAFVSAVTHELRTPLTTLRMYTEMLSDGMVADEARRAAYLQTLRAEADRLGHLVENVLAYSRLERNRAGYEAQPVPLRDVLSRVTDRLTDRARQAGMQFVARVPDEVADLTVRANPLGLEQILFNLVDNACKYAAGAGDKRIELSASAAANAPRVELCVRDHGAGVPPTRLATLFRPFSKSVQEAADSAPGLGLGLTISRRLAVSMGGDLRAATPAGGGAAFIVRLPRVDHPP